MSVKPILFNTDMVRAILDGRKTVTRRLIKPQPPYDVQCPLGYCTDGYKSEIGKFAFGSHENGGKMIFFKPPYQPGDILYVRETWERFDCCSCEGDEHGNCPKEPKKSVLDKSCGCYMYRATDEISGDAKWHPSIHMPKEAARIWLKVKNVRVERLQDITEDGTIQEGIFPSNCRNCTSKMGCDTCPDEGYDEIDNFVELWNSTIKKSDLNSYGWTQNPWVWVIEFERIEVN